MYMNNGYYELNVRGTFATMSGFYFLYRPVFVPYEKLKTVFLNQGILDWSFGMVEESSIFGMGYIGFPVKSNSPVPGATLKEVEGHFIAKDIYGPYSQLESEFKELMNAYPKSKRFITIYRNDPDVTKPEEYHTTIACEV